jgi:hypothetical protein
MARRIDTAFTDLMIVAVQLLPGAAPFANRAKLLEVTSAARGSADLSRWPAACVALLEACEQVGAGSLDALRAGEIGKASSCEWPEPGAFYTWQRRADIGDARGAL